jgi:hypothetical protein
MRFSELVEAIKDELIQCGAVDQGVLAEVAVDLADRLDVDFGLVDEDEDDEEELEEEDLDEAN